MHAPSPLPSAADAPTLAAGTPTRRRVVESFGLSDRGHRRSHNEDHFVVASLQRAVEVRQTNLDAPQVFDRLRGPQAYLFAVADGVGGVAGGRLASGRAVEVTVQYLGETVGCYHATAAGQEHAFQEPLERAVRRAHESLRTTFAPPGGPGGATDPNAVAGNTGGQGPATTLTIALVVWPRCYLVHVGDSRAYLHRAGRLAPLTRDQTLGAYLIEQNAISAQQAERAGLHHVLASAVGAADMTPAVHAVDLAPGDTLLLCTDGLTNEVPEGDVAAVLSREPTAEGACRTLVQRALDAGGRDNVTVVVARMLE